MIVHELSIPDISIVLDDTKTVEEIQASSEQISKDTWIARNPFGYTILHYDDCVKILRDKRWHNPTKRTMDIFDLGFEEDGVRALPINTVEGDDHTRLRRLVAPVFTPSQADNYRPLMRSHATKLLDNLPDKTDLYHNFTKIYPTKIISEIFGSDEEGQDKLDTWATNIFKIFNGKVREEQEDIQKASSEMKLWFENLIQNKRKEPGSDVISTLIAARDSNDLLSTGEIIMMGVSLLLAGVDTVRNQLATIVALMLENPDQWSIFLENPEFYAPRAVEEGMRYSASTRGTGRVASEDIDYKGVTFPQGTLVFPLFSTANREQDKFKNADIFDIRKEIPNKPHLTFGSGIHHCLGAHLARAEMQEALLAIAEVCPGILLDGTITWKNSTVAIYGPSSMPVDLNKGSSNLHRYLENIFYE